MQWPPKRNSSMSRTKAWFAILMLIVGKKKSMNWRSLWIPDRLKKPRVPWLKRLRPSVTGGFCPIPAKRIVPEKSVVLPVISSVSVECRRLSKSNTTSPVVFKMVDVFSKEKRSKIMSHVRSKGNLATEEKLTKLFRENGIKGWRRNYRLFGSPDFVFPKERIAVFVDGEFWHGHPTRAKI